LENQKQNTGEEVVFLLKQQRNLYHQLKSLAQKQSKIFWTSASPEDLVRILSGRRKLIEKLRQVNDKLRPIKANWQNISLKIAPGQLEIARQLAGSVALLVAQLRDITDGKDQAEDILSDTAQLAYEFSAEDETL